MQNKNNIKAKFIKPTVGDVYSLMIKAASRYGLEDTTELAVVLGVSKRTFRRWKNNVDIEPQALSVISYQGYALLYAAAEQKPLAEPIKGIDVALIPSNLIMNSVDFEQVQLTKEDIKQVIGLKSISKTGIQTFAQNVGISPNALASKINNYKGEKVSFGTWALILFLCGVPVNKVLYFNK